MKIKLIILYKYLCWYQKRFCIGESGEGGDAIETTKAILDQFIKDKWRGRTIRHF